MDTKEAGKLGYQVLIKKYPPEVRREWCVKGGKASKGKAKRTKARIELYERVLATGRRTTSMSQMPTQEVW